MAKEEPHLPVFLLNDLKMMEEFTGLQCAIMDFRSLGRLQNGLHEAGILEKQISARKQNVLAGSPTLLSRANARRASRHIHLDEQKQLHRPLREQVYGERRFRFLRRPKRF
jgi:hypothetical protein